MKPTVTKKRTVAGCIQMFAAICLSMAPIKALADCGHCEGEYNYIYWACDIHHGPPCSTSETCLWEGLPPGIYWMTTCSFNYVEITDCKVNWWSGNTTSRRGVCVSDCSCILYGDPFEDHGSGTMCIQSGSCVGG